MSRQYFWELGQFKDVRSLKIHLEKAGVDKCPVCNAVIKDKTFGSWKKHARMKKDEEHKRLLELLS